MSSRPVLYPFFRAPGLILGDAEETPKAIILHARMDAVCLDCPKCGTDAVTKAGTVDRTFHHGTVNATPVKLRVAVQRVRCAAFRRLVLRLSKHMTLSALAQFLQVDPKTLKAIQKEFLLERFSDIDLSGLECIAIDEVYTGRVGKFITIALDLVAGAVVYIGEGKSKESLGDFCEKLKASGAKIKAVASDMSPAFTLWIAEKLPDAVHVYDRFHVIKLFGDKLSDLRREVQRSATAEQKEVLKGTRFLLLKNPGNLDDEKQEKKRLDDALRINAPLATAYYLRDELRLFWEQGTKSAAKSWLLGWIARARASGIRQLIVMARTLEAGARQLLAWYDYPISTAALEGVNNKIGAIQRQAFGFRDKEFFHLKIFASHHASYHLIG
jgi:transposase